MKTRIIAVLVLTVSLMYSCQKEEDVKPATNPRFSVAFIQELNGEGVQFAANVFDFGSDEILEYGFVYSPTSVPKVEKDDVVSQKGKPSASFELKGTHSMKLGEKYWVAAFIKTSKGIVYSKVIDFVSKGSLGFLFSEIVAPPTVFFGDTLEVRGSNFSKILWNYRISVEGVPGIVFDVSESGFKFTLPNFFPFDEKQVAQGLYDIQISVAGKVLELEYPLNFRDPGFQIDRNRTYNYEDTIKIEGRFFLSESFLIKYLSEDGKEYTLPIVGFSDSQIKFRPVAKFQESNPDIQVTVRGKKHIIPDAFKMKAPEIDPGQNFSNISFSRITVSGKNLNIHYPEWNSLSFAKSDLDYIISSVSPTSISFELLAGESGYIPRENEIFFNIAGQKSVNSAKVKFTDPVLPFMNADQVFKEYYGDGGGVSMGDYGYFFRVKSIYKFTPSTRKIELVAENKNSNVLIASIFTLKSPNGKIYSGGFANNVVSNQSSPEMFEFDPTNNSLIKLPNIPSQVTRPLRVYATDKHLYYEGGFKNVPNEGYIEVKDRWRFDFLLKTWEKLDKQIEINDYSPDFKTFWYDGKLYKIGIDHELGGFNVLKEFDPINDSWITKTILPYNGEIFSEVIPIIGNEAYLAYYINIIKLNLDTFQVSFVQNLDPDFHSFNPYQIMAINGKIYSPNGTYGYQIVELDPTYFEY